MVHHCGLGRHAVALDTPALALNEKLEVTYEFAYILAVVCPKIAAICLYLRIFVQKPYRRACYILMVVLVTHASLAVVLTFAMRIPLKKPWNPKATNVCCIDLIAWWRWSTLPSSITDLIMLVLPVPMILKLRLPNKDKIGLLLTFAAGGL